MTAAASQKELDFIIQVLEPEQKENGTLAIHCRIAETAGAKKPGNAAEAQRKTKKRCTFAAPQLAPWMQTIIAVFAACACYIALAVMEIGRRGYFGIGGELFLSIGVGYLVYCLLGNKKIHPAERWI